jgi:PAS domain S-box-containing protein
MVNERAAAAGWWRQGWTGPRGVALVAALISGLLFGAGWYQLGRWREEQQIGQMRDDVRVALGTRSNALVLALERRLALLDGLHAFVELNLGAPDFGSKFAAFAARLRTAVPGIRDFAVARGTAYQFVYPTEGNERILGYDLLMDARPEVRADTKRALESQGIVLSGPIDFVQGGIGLIARRAVREDHAVWGLAAVVLDLKPILAEAGLERSRGDLVVAVRVRGGPAILGSDQMFTGQSVVQRIDLPDGQWEIAGRPVGGWEPELARDRQLWLASGFVLSMVPMAVVFVLTWRQRVRGQYQARTEALVEERTAALARTTVIVENSPVILVRWLEGEDWPVEYVSDNIAQFGYAADDFHSGRLRWADILVPDDLERIRLEVARGRKAGVHRTHQEYRILTTDGAVRWMEDRTSVVEQSGGRPIHQGIIIDITERKQREEAQFEAERRLRDILESVQMVAVMTDTEGRVTFCNSFLLALTGWSRDEVIGADWFDRFVPASDRAAVRARFRDALVSGSGGGSHEHPIVARDGGQREMFWDSTRILNASGAVAGVASFGRDLTDLRQLEAQYLQSQKMEAVGQLAGGIAHDFNNLLQVIAGFAGLALDDLPEGAPARREISEIQRAATRATTLVRQLLAFSRRQTMERQLIDPNETVATLLTMLQRVIGEHIELEFVPGANIPPVVADSGQVEQVLVNLCVNARDAMPDGGRIRLSTALVTIDAEFMENRSWARPGRFVLLSVFDNGPGIPPEILDHVFEPFFTTKDVGKGTGLGLATVYGIVKQHDGMIDVATGPESGTTFTVYLPADATETRPAQPSRVEAATDGAAAIDRHGVSDTPAGS